MDLSCLAGKGVMVITRGRNLSLLALLLAILVTACASPSARAHQNFKNIMQGDVGQRLDDPYVYRNRSKSLYVTSRPLPNGNVEEEFRGGRTPCKVFFEIDNKARQIVGWRYEGTEQQCIV